MTPFETVHAAAVVFAAASAVLLAAVSFFADVLLKTDRQLRLVTDALVWCMVLSLLAVTAAGAWEVFHR